MSSIKFIPRQKCLLCGATNLVFKSEIQDFDSSYGKFKLVQCPQCKMYYTSPFPSPATLPLLYQNRTTRNFDTHNSRLFENLKDFVAGRLIKKLTRHLTSSHPRIVDFGCGNGRFAKCFKKVLPHAEVTAVDFENPVPNLTSPAITSASTSKIDFSLIYQSTDDFYVNDKKYDLIFLRHVLEHVGDPQNFLNLLVSKLTPQGFIYLEVPNIHNGLSRFFDRYLPSYFPPYHLLHYTPENLTYLLNSLALNYQIGFTEMPIMSNLLANILRQDLNNLHRLAGVVLHPLQLLLCFKKHTVLTAIIKARCQ